MTTFYLQLLVNPVLVVLVVLADDCAEPVNARRRVPERRDGRRRRHPAVGPPARAAQPARLAAAAAAVPPRPHPHVGRRGDVSLQSGTGLSEAFQYYILVPRRVSLTRPKLKKTRKPANRETFPYVNIFQLQSQPF